MRIVFLGTSAAVSSNKRDNTCLLVDDVLVDCPGNAFGKMVRAGYEPLRLRTIIITHRHVDHSYGLPSLLEMLRLSGKEEPLKICINEDFFFEMRQILSTYGLIREDFPLEMVPIRVDGCALFEGSLRIETFPVKHSVPNFGLKFSTSSSCVVYTSDTEPCEEVIEQAKNADVLIHEATCAETVTGRKEGHSCVEDAARIAKQAGVKNLCLVHLGPELEEHLCELTCEAEEILNGRVIVPEDLDRAIV
ncbi:MAG: MBL fold metallo-hydrolase [Pseudothermotoga sp.]